MIPVLLLELSDWNRKTGWSSLCLIIVAVTLIGVFLTLAPEWCCEVLTGILIWIGFKAGEEDRYSFKSREGISANHLQPWQILCGKIAAVLVIEWLHLLVVLPALVLMVAIWGVPWGTLAEVALIVGIAMIAMAGLSALLLNHSENEVDLGLYLGVGVWLMITFFLQPLQWFNPFILVWRALQPGKGLAIGWLLPNLGLALCLWFINNLLLRREEGKTK